MVEVQASLDRIYFLVEARRERLQVRLAARLLVFGSSKFALNILLCAEQFGKGTSLRARRRGDRQRAPLAFSLVAPLQTLEIFSA